MRLMHGGAHLINIWEQAFMHLLWIFIFRRNDFFIDVTKPVANERSLSTRENSLKSIMASRVTSLRGRLWENTIAAYKDQ